MMPKPLGPVPTVYSFYSSEIEHTVQHALANLNRHDGIHKVLQRNYDPGLDDLHLPLMRQYEQFARQEGVIGLESLPEKWFTSGSSEAIFHLMNGLAVAEPLYQFTGEYQGYQAYADAVGRQLRTVNTVEELLAQPKGIVFMSSPASKDGNIVGSATLNAITDRHQVVLDLAYMGMTEQPLNIDLTNPRILAVVGSLSKPFGLYYYRIGFCYSRWNIPSLYGTRWFKNALSIKLGEAVLEEATSKKWAAFKDKYFTLQKSAVKEANSRFGLFDRGLPDKIIQPSDVWLLGHMKLREDDRADLQPFKRADQNYRFCLTPYYMEWRNA